MNFIHPRKQCANLSSHAFSQIPSVKMLLHLFIIGNAAENVVCNFSQFFLHIHNKTNSRAMLNTSGAT